MNRRQFLRLGAVAGGMSLAGCTFHSKEESPKRGTSRIALQTVVEGLDFPTAMKFMPNGHRLISERDGRVRRHTDDELADDSFLDVSDRMAPVRGERGLLGLSLHPRFADNRKLYVRYSAPLREWMPDEYSHTAVLSEFSVSGDLTGVVPDSERILLEIPQPGLLHQAGDIAFGPDGLLYIALGDGEGYDVQETEDWYWWNELGDASQNTTENLLGGILRIDVDSTGSEKPYSIPSDNPLVNGAGRDEYYAWGFRNPYRISFDDERLFVADVGLGFREEVSIVEKGGNYGWPVMEGSACSRSGVLKQKIDDSKLNVFHPKVWLSTFNLLSPYTLCPDSTDDGSPLNDPVIDYQRVNPERGSESHAVVGGYVYRGNEIPELQGAYIFGDYVPPSPLFAARRRGGEQQWSMTELEVSDTESGRMPGSVLSFARSPSGDVFALTTRFASGSGRVQRIAEATE